MNRNVLKGAQFLTATDAPPLPPLPSGSPRLYWRLPGGFPSINEVLYLSPKARAEVERAERSRGYSDAIGYASSLRLRMSVQPWRGKPVTRLLAPLLVAPIFTYVSVYRGDRRKRDIYNAAVKGYIDGCTDAGLWVDDNEEHHTDFWVHFAGRGLAHYAEVSIYAAPY